MIVSKYYWWIFVYICMYVYVYIYICIIYIYLYGCEFVCGNVFLSVCMYVCVYIKEDKGKWKEKVCMKEGILWMFINKLKVGI